MLQKSNYHRRLCTVLTSFPAIESYVGGDFVRRIANDSVKSQGCTIRYDNNFAILRKGGTVSQWPKTDIVVFRAFVYTIR